MRRLKSIFSAVLAVLIVAAYIPVAPVEAQTSAALSIAPKKNYVMDPGETIDDTITIRNADTANDLFLSLRVIDFTYTDDSGTPKLMLDTDLEPTTWSLRSYLETPKSVSVKRGTSDSFDIKLSIPSNLGAGSYYSAIIYSTSAPDGGNVGLSASGVTLVFVTVPGKVSEDLKLTKFGPYDNVARKYRMFTMGEPQHIGYTLENKGNVTEAPVGSIVLKSMFGHEYRIDNINPNQSLALIGQTRTFTACIKSKLQEMQLQGASTDASTCVSPGLWPGFYTASINVFYGQNGNYTQEISKNTIFWYIPLWFLILIIILLLAIAFAIWRTVVAVRRKTNSPRGRKSRLMRK